MKRRNPIAMHINFRRLIEINEFVAQMFGHGHQWPFMPRQSFIIAKLKTSQASKLSQHIIVHRTALAHAF
jgi:hypothetical protein